MDYKYLFPYEKIPYGSKIIIYGAGDLGQDYLFQMEVTHYCKVVAIADRNYKKYSPMSVRLISPKDIHLFEFEYVVIALRMQAAYPELLRVLNGQGVDKTRIICVFERNVDDVTIFRSEENEDNNGDKKSYDISKQSIAILSTGGFGDMVIQKRFVTELIKFAPDCRIDFYNIKAIEFLEHLYNDTENVNQVINDLGFRFQKNKNKYGLALTIEACHFIRIDKWDENELEQSFPKEFTRRIGILKSVSDKENIGINTPAYLTMMRRKFKGLNAYNGFNYEGAFNITDKKVNIPLEDAFEAVFQKLALGKYITVNYGNGDSKSNEGISKSWNKESFNTVIHEFKKKRPEISVVQLGGEEADRLDEVDHYILGEDFRLVLYVLKNSIFHLDIEGGLVHIATQLGTKCIVLFGPTVSEYYGYCQNTNIRVGSCCECWGLYSNVNRCARDMKEPECMKKITPDIVIKAIDEYMEIGLYGK